MAPPRAIVRWHNRGRVNGRSPVDVNILHVIHSIDPRSGGPSHALRGLVAEQVRRGHRVAILTTNAQSAEPWAAEAEFRARMAADPALAGVELVMARAYGRSRPFARYSWTPEGRRWLARRLADVHLRPHILHIHGVFSHLTTFAPRLARRHGVPYILRPAGTFSPPCLAMGRRNLKRWFTAAFVARDLRQAAAVQATTPAEAEELRHQFGLEHVAIVPHGVAMPPENGATADQARAALGLPRLARVILYLSRLAPKKRPHWVAQALLQLRAGGQEVVAVFAGPDAGAEQELDRAIATLQLQDAVCRVGFVTGSEKDRLLAAADVLVLPSRSENFGVVVVEALAHGLPAVVTPGVASHIHVDASGCGRTVADCLDAFVDGVRQVLAAGRDELGRRGRQYVARNLTWQAVADQMEALYRDILRQWQTLAH